jgi:hypothetical protein
MRMRMKAGWKSVPLDNVSQRANAIERTRSITIPLMGSFHREDPLGYAIPSWGHSIETASSITHSPHGIIPSRGPARLRIPLMGSFHREDPLDYGFPSRDHSIERTARLRNPLMGSFHREDPLDYAFLSWDHSIERTRSTTIPLMGSCHREAPLDFDSPHEIIPSRGPARLRIPSWDHSIERTGSNSQRAES